MCNDIAVMNDSHNNRNTITTSFNITHRNKGTQPTETATVVQTVGGADAGRREPRAQHGRHPAAESKEGATTEVDSMPWGRLTMMEPMVEEANALTKS